MISGWRQQGRSINPELSRQATSSQYLGSTLTTASGGGYCIPASPHMFEFMFQIVSILAAQGKEVAVLMLSYDLAPTGVYPRQLQQAATLLNHVLLNLKFAPSNIILAGDSAGSNLAIGLLSHISHPHPSTTVPVPKVELQENFRAAVLISPWTSFDTSDDSFVRNAYKDCVGSEPCKQWSAAWIGDAWPHKVSSDYYNQPGTAGESWWEGLRVDKVLVVAGGEEVLVDGIQRFAGTLTASLGPDKVELVVVPGEYHDQPSIDLQFGYTEKQEGEQAKLIKRWIGSKL